MPIPTICPRCPHNLGFLCEECYPIYDISEMHSLKARLGEARTDRIRMHTAQAPQRPFKARWIENPYKDRLATVSLNHSSPEADIITGIAALDIGGKQTLSASRLLNLLQCNDRLSSEVIMDGMALQKRQAQRYLAAAKLTVFHLNRQYTPHP